MAESSDDDLPMRLAEATRNMSLVTSSGARGVDIGTAAVQCAAIILPGVRALVLDVDEEQNVARISSSINLPTLNDGEEIPLSRSSVLDQAIDAPLDVQQVSCKAFERLLPDKSESLGNSGDVVCCKAVYRADAQDFLLAIITDGKSTDRTERVLIALSELLIVLCAARDATDRHAQSVDVISQAKREWERTVDALPEIVCLVDHEGHIVRVNRTVERWGLADVTKLRGTPVHDLLHRGCNVQSCPMSNALSLSMAEQSTNGFLESAITDDILGKTLIVHTRLIDGVAADNLLPSHAAGVIVITDITALHRAQQELSTLNSELESRVEARTSELKYANSILAEEIARRTEVERELQQSRDELADLTQQLINAQEDERRRLSQELHDSLGQSLGAIKYSLERVAAMHENPEHGDPAKEIASIVDSVNRATTETRSIAISLRPPMLDELGTASALAWLCQHFGEIYDAIELHTIIDVSNSDIPEALSTPIYRITQEALNNVAKHASAKTVMVSLAIEDDVLRLEVLDDGVGIENRANLTGKFKKLNKIGRLGMRERAAHSNGTLNIESWPGEGTRVTAEWMLSEVRDIKEHKNEE